MSKSKSKRQGQLWTQLDAGNGRLVPADHSPPSRAEMEARCIRMFQRTWTTIAPDVLDVYDTMEGRRDISQAEAHDAVLSGGLEEGYPALYGDDATALTWLVGQDSDALTYHLLELALPFATYGA
jgi:hypothetical protein